MTKPSWLFFLDTSVDPKRGPTEDRRVSIHSSHAAWLAEEEQIILLEFSIFSCFSLLRSEGEKKEERGHPHVNGFQILTSLADAESLLIVPALLHIDDRFSSLRFVRSRACFSFLLSFLSLILACSFLTEREAERNVHKRAMIPGCLRVHHAISRKEERSSGVEKVGRHCQGKTS